MTYLELGMEDVTLVPLRARSGDVRAFTVIDADRAEEVNAHRWSLTSNGYVVRGCRVDGRQRLIQLHRQLVGLAPGDPRRVDHRNRHRLDNRRTNLRVVSQAENNQNLSPRLGVTSSHRGVSRFRDGWRAVVSVDGHRHELGVFANEDDAAAAASRARARLMPYASESVPGSDALLACLPLDELLALLRLREA